MSAREFAVRLYNEGITSVNRRNEDPKFVPHAYQLFASVPYADPTWHLGYYQAGNNSSDQQLFHGAIACWRRALECEFPDDTEKAKAVQNLGWRLHCIGRTQEAHDMSMQALKLDPKLAGAWLNLSVIEQIKDHSVVSVECARRCHELWGNAESEFCLAFALLFNRQFKEGFHHFESRFEHRLKEYLQFPYPKWKGEPDKTVFLVADQGLGDTLSFARFVEATCKRARYVHARIQPPLMRLFSNAFRHIPNLNLLPAPYPFPEADAWTTFVSLPYALGLDDKEIRNTPHIDAGKFWIPDSWKVPGRKLHIGIAWAGSPLNDINNARSIPFEPFLELYRVPGIQLYSLQVDERGQDMHNAGAAAVVRDLKQYVNDVCDTLAILKHLDLVITCESALGHICSLGGTECWVPYSYLGRDYRVGLTGEDQLWSKYRIFRQGPDQQWFPVFDRIVEALRERV